jgi:Flp pilus assembly protein TadG
MNIKPKHPTNGEKTRGQGMVEFALVLPMLLVMLVATFEFSRGVWIYMAVNTASREAARYGSGIGDRGDGTPQYLDCAGIQSAALAVGAPAGVETADITITYDEGPGTTVLGTCPMSIGDLETGDRINVQVVGNFEITPIFMLADLPVFTINSSVSRTIIMEIVVE